jgi:hypothetical protein
MPLLRVHVNRTYYNYYAEGHRHEDASRNIISHPYCLSRQTLLDRETLNSTLGTTHSPQARPDWNHATTRGNHGVYQMDGRPLDPNES